MDDKVSVSIREIENGYIVDRSWYEGKGEKKEYKSEQVYLKDLSPELKKMFGKGKVEKDDKEKTDNERVEEMAKDLEEKPEK